MADRRTVNVHARLSPAERAVWQAKAAAVGMPLSALLRRAMARTRTWIAPEADIERERTRQVARIGRNLNQLPRWVDTHTAAAEAIGVIPHLVTLEMRGKNARSMTVHKRPSCEIDNRLISAAIKAASVPKRCHDRARARRTHRRTATDRGRATPFSTNGLVAVIATCHCSRLSKRNVEPDQMA